MFPGLPVLLVLLVPKAHKVLLDPQAHKVLLDPQARRAHREFRGRREIPLRMTRL